MGFLIRKEISFLSFNHVKHSTARYEGLYLRVFIRPVSFWRELFIDHQAKRLVGFQKKYNVYFPRSKNLQKIRFCYLVSSISIF